MIQFILKVLASLIGARQSPSTDKSVEPVNSSPVMIPNKRGVVQDWSQYQNFSAAEFNCKHTGSNRMDQVFMAKLQALRSEYGKSLTVTSGYRDPTHPVEARKDKPGSHALGRAVDLSVRGADAYRVIELAMKHGFTGIGVAGSFIHLDDLESNERGFYRPTVWVYYS